MWNVARKLYIRKRLRGEWFPEDILRKNKPVSRCGAHSPCACLFGGRPWRTDAQTPTAAGS